MYVGKQYTVTSSGAFTLTFRCVHCRHKSTATVLGFGQGAGQSAFFLDNDGAQKRARERANVDARLDALSVVKLGRCPKCQRRDEGAYVWLKIATGVGMLCAAGACAGLGAFYDSLSHTGFAVWIGALLAPVMAWAIYAKQSTKWKTAEQRVAFLEEPEADAPPAGGA